MFDSNTLMSFKTKSIRLLSEFAAYTWAEPTPLSVFFFDDLLNLDWIWRWERDFICITKWDISYCTIMRVIAFSYRVIDSPQVSISFSTDLRSE